MPDQGTALNDDHPWHEPVTFRRFRRPAGKHNNLAAIKGGVRPQSQAHGSMPVQLAAPVFR
jgi:hypothetical protein